MTAAALAGWLLAVGVAIVAGRLRRRLSLVGDAVHEIRGPVAAVSLAVVAAGRRPGGGGLVPALESELARMRMGLADLEAARTGGRAAARPTVVCLERLVRTAADGWRPAAWAQGRDLAVRWEAGPVNVLADRSRLAQALGNLVANAMEHGTGQVELSVRRRGPETVRLEVRDGGPALASNRAPRAADRGRGLRIVAQAITEAGGAFSFEMSREGAGAVVDLPIVDAAGAVASVGSLESRRERIAVSAVGLAQPSR